MILSSIWKGKYSFIDDWFMMGSPFPMLGLFAAYIIFSLKLGPMLMENRRPMKLDNVTRVYNLFQIIACSMVVVIAPNVGFSWRHAWQCVPVPDANKAVSEIMFKYYTGYWYFIVLRTFDFLETIIFVLRKKQNQVSMLHVYHHLAVVSLLWIVLKYIGGVGGAFLGTLNSAVHIPMYTYYFLSSFESMKRFTAAVKSWITRLQISQLVILFFHCIRIITACELSPMYFLQAANLALLVFMFVMFYIKTYNRDKLSKSL